LALFCLDRGLYYVLIPSGTLDRAPIAVYYLLSEWPIYIFFSIFTLMIFFWAEIIHFWHLGSKAFLTKLRIPLIVTNVVLYLLFICILISFFRVDIEEQKKLRMAYQLIIAIVCILLVAGVAMFGGKLWMFNRKSMANMKKKKATRLKKFTLVLAVSMVSLLLQVAFLLVNTFSTIKDIEVAVIYSFIVELFPCATFLVLFAPQSENKPPTPSTSRGSGSGSVSSGDSKNSRYNMRLKKTESGAGLKADSVVELNELASSDSQ